MKSTWAFCLLLVFVAVGFPEVNSDDYDDWDTDYAILEEITDPYGDSADHMTRALRSDDYDDWETDFAILEDIDDPYGDSIDVPQVRGLKEKFQALKVRKRCDCSVLGVCGCCIQLLFEQKVSHKVCFNVTGLMEMKGLELSLVLDNNKLYTKKIVEKERCVKVPYTAKIAKVCLDLYNMTVDAVGLHACPKFNLRLFTKKAVAFDFQCLLFTQRKIIFEKPSGDPNTALLNFNIHKNLTVPHVTLGRR